MLSFLCIANFLVFVSQRGTWFDKKWIAWLSLELIYGKSVLSSISITFQACAKDLYKIYLHPSIFFRHISLSLKFFFFQHKSSLNLFLLKTHMLLPKSKFQAQSLKLVLTILVLSFFSMTISKSIIKFIVVCCGKLNNAHTVGIWNPT